MRLTLPYKSVQGQTNAEYLKQQFLMYVESDVAPISYFYSEEKTSPFGFLQIAGSTVTTEDLGSKLLTDLLESKQKTIGSPIIKTREVVDWERIVKKLNALEAVVGLLNDLTPQQITEFDKTVKRRPLFEK